jgi:hypothetical protein
MRRTKRSKNEGVVPKEEEEGHPVPTPADLSPEKVTFGILWMGCRSEQN